MNIIFKPNIEKLEKNKDIPGLIKAFNYEDHCIKTKVMDALVKINDKRAVDALVNFIGEIDKSKIKEKIQLEKSLIFNLIIRASDARESDFANYSKNKSAEALINMCKEDFNALNYIIELFAGGYGSSEAISKILLDMSIDQIDNIIYTLRRQIQFYNSPAVWKGHEKKQKLENLSDEIIKNAGMQALEILLRYLKSDDKENRIWASYWISRVLEHEQIENEQIVKDLRFALNDSEGAVVRNTIRALGQIKSEEASNALVNIFKTKEEKELKNEASKAIIAIGRFSIDALAEALRHEREDVRFFAALSLSKIEGKEDVKTDLINALNDINWEVRECAVKALSEIKDKNVEAALIRALEDNDSSVRSSVVDALSKIKDKDAQQALIKALSDDSMWIRYKDALILGKRGLPQGIGIILEQLFEVPDQPVSKTLIEIRDALYTIIPKTLLTHEITDKAINASTYSDYLEIESGHTLEKSNSSIKYLCDLNSPITSNLLNLIFKKKDTEVIIPSLDFHEDAYRKKLDFQTQRDQASEELKRRGNPPYKPEFYLKDKV